MDEFAEDIVTPIVEYPGIEKKKFLPWHKPRKHWCRYNQWLSGLIWVVDTTKKFGGDSSKTFNYIGLPGNDLLDLRMFADTCKRKKVKLKYLGFNTAATNELHLSESELHKKGNIASGSKVVVEPLENLARKQSSAYATAKQFGGFHMINLDLCNSIAKSNPSGDTYIEALGHLLELQANYMREPWTLFITTKVCKDSVIGDVMMPLLKAVKDNNETNAKFTEKLFEELYVESISVERAIDDISLLSDQEFVDLFALGFSKWLLKIYLSISHAWNIEMTKSCKYMTGDVDRAGEPDMISLAFRFEYVPQTISDEYQLLQPRQINQVDSELQIALNMITTVSEIFNLDRKMESDKSMAEELAKHSAKLMTGARYEEDEYYDWVSEGCP